MGFTRKPLVIAIENEKFDGMGFVLIGEISVIKENCKGIRTILANFKQGKFSGR